MPGFITHYICGQAVARAVTSDAQDIIAKNGYIFNLGTQGPDIFFYYLPGLVKKRTRGIGELMHHQNSGAFILSMADCMRRAKKAEDREVLFAYTAGYLTHYALDAGAHPYVYAKTKKRQPDQTRRSILDSVDHRKFETAIDVLMLKLMSSKKPADYKLWQLLRADTRQTGTASSAVSASVKAAYARDINPKDVYKSMMYMIQLTRFLQSRKGRRKFCMELIENLMVGEHLVSSIIHMQEVKDGVDYLNMGKTPWRAPWKGQDYRRDSFVELYHEAVDDACEMVSMLYDYMHGGVSRAKMLERIGSRSLSTGAECV